jgi:hypothetical protein
VTPSAESSAAGESRGVPISRDRLLSASGQLQQMSQLEMYFAVNIGGPRQSPTVCGFRRLIAPQLLQHVAELNADIGSAPGLKPALGSNIRPPWDKLRCRAPCRRGGSALPQRAADKRVHPKASCRRTGRISWCAGGSNTREAIVAKARCSIPKSGPWLADKENHPPSAFVRYTYERLRREAN